MNKILHSKREKGKNNRNVPLKHLQKKFKTSNIEFFALQKKALKLQI